MVDSSKKDYRKRDYLYLLPLWLLSLIVPDAEDLYSYQRKEFKRRDVFYLGIFLILPLVWNDLHFHHLMVLAGVNAILALGLSLFLGYAGQISLGHAAFFGIGAYTTAILTTQYGLSPFLAFWASAASASVIAYLIGRPLLKLKGYFLALATLGFGEIFLVFVKESQPLTGGVIGIFNIPWFSIAGFLFDTYLKQYYLIWGVLIGLLLFSKNLVRSKMGRALLAIAVSEDAAKSIGINAVKLKTEIFVLSAAYAGFAGSLFVCVMSIANPDTFSLGLSTLIVMMVILGGMGNLYGPIFGSIFLTGLMDLLGKYQEWSLPIYGVLFILLLIFFPEGIGKRLGIRLIYLISYFPKKKRREEIHP